MLAPDLEYLDTYHLGAENKMRTKNLFPTGISRVRHLGSCLFQTSREFLSSGTTLFGCVLG